MISIIVFPVITHLVKPLVLLSAAPQNLKSLGKDHFATITSESWNAHPERRF
ncbi:hypothetical protein KC19_4G132200 [Ceratodon purpureus]|uniref:Uncharacterized protein n=1 Tax=Ceratodon purpureus TaxID=3225 RepID=A0A8T0IBN4_CERPU|nr:hypothetical protein KC19_4G132200 [Ceratodon purpureus]